MANEDKERDKNRLCLDVWDLILKVKWSFFFLSVCNFRKKRHISLLLTEERKKISLWYFFFLIQGKEKKFKKKKIDINNWTINNIFLSSSVFLMLFFKKNVSLLFYQIEVQMKVSFTLQQSRIFLMLLKKSIINKKNLQQHNELQAIKFTKSESLKNLHFLV